MFLRRLSTVAAGSAVKSGTSVVARDKPLFISIEGNIGAGKTTLAESLASKMPTRLFKEPIVTNPYLTDFYADPKKYALKTQLWLLNHRFATYQNALNYLNDEKTIRSSPACIIDRSVWSDWVFARQAFADGHFSNSEFQFYSDLRTRLARRLPLRNIVLYLEVDPKECLHRVHNVRKRSFEAGITLEYLSGLDKFYKEFCNEMREKTTVVTVDWNNYGKADDVMKILNEL